MNLRETLLGESRPRTRVVILALLLPLSASMAFLLGYDVVLGFVILYLAMGIAILAGWTRAGVLAGTASVFLAVLWRFVFPPFVGYLRWSMDTRYTPPRVLGYKLDPPGELIEGLTYGPLYALIAAGVLGGSAYLVGVAGRRLTHQWNDEP